MDVCGGDGMSLGKPWALPVFPVHAPSLPLTTNMTTFVAKALKFHKSDVKRVLKPFGSSQSLVVACSEVFGKKKLLVQRIEHHTRMLLRSYFPHSLPSHVLTLNS